MHPAAVAGFTLAIFPLIATPGASLTLLAQRVVTDGPSAYVPVTLGTIAGLFTHATLAAVGLSALVMRSAQLFTAVKLAGAIYLVALGLWMWRDRPARTVHRAGTIVTQAYLGNVLNPKAASIYLTLGPQFVTAGSGLVGQMLILATAHAALMAVWLGGWTAVLARTRSLRRSPGFARLLRRICAAVLIGIGLRTAW